MIVLFSDFTSAAPKSTLLSTYCIIFIQGMHVMLKYQFLSVFFIIRYVSTDEIMI